MAPPDLYINSYEKRENHSKSMGEAKDGKNECDVMTSHANRLFTVITIFLHFRLEHWLAIVFSYLNYQSVVSYGRCDNTVTRYAFVIFRTRYILVQIYIFAMSGFKFLMKKGSLGANSIFLVFVTEVSLSLSSNIKAGAEA